MHDYALWDVLSFLYALAKMYLRMRNTAYTIHYCTLYREQLPSAQIFLAAYMRGHLKDLKMS